MSRPPLVGVSTSEVRRATDHSVVPQGSRAGAARARRALPRLRALGRWAARDPHAVHGSPSIRCSRGSTPSACPAGPTCTRRLWREAHAKLGPTEPSSTCSSRSRAAVRRGVPVLGICRGAQLLNVALGRTLHQHLPDLSAEVEHRQQASGRQVTHEVKLASDSRLAKLMGRTEVRVNSFHHQAPATLGPGCALSHGRRRNRRGPRERRRGLRVRSPWHAEGLVEIPSTSPCSRGSCRRLPSTPPPT